MFLPLIFFCLFLLIPFPPVFSRTAEGKCESSEECTDDIKKAEEMISRLSREKDTLQNQIKYLNTQVNLTELKIAQTQASIKILKEEIANLTVKIDKLDVYLNYLSNILIGQITESYKLQKRIPQIAILEFV